MSKSTLRSWYLATFLFLIGLVPAPAQTNAASTNAPAATAPTPVAVGDVVDSAQLAAAKLKEYQGQIGPDTLAQEVRAGLPENDRAITKRLGADKRLEQSNPTLGNLQNSQSAWQSIGDTLNSTQKDLSSRVNVQHALLATLNGMTATWKATLDGAEKAKATPEIIQTIEQVQGQIADTTHAVNTDLNDLYSLQIAVAQQAAQMQAGLEAVDKAVLTAQKRLFEQTKPILWDPAAFSTEGTGMVMREKASLGEQVDHVGSYLKPKTGAILIQIILLIVLIATFYWIRTVVCEHAKTERGLCEAEHILKAPLTTALLLALMTSHWLYPPTEAPRLLWSVIGAVTLIPTVIIVRRLISAELIPLLYATVVAYFIDQVRNAATPDGAFTRFVLLVEIIGACIFILGALRTKKLSISDNRTLAEKIVRAYLHVAFFVFLISGFANFLGYVDLGLHIGNGMLESSYMAVVFYAGVRIVDALVLAVMSLRPISGFGMVRRHHDLVYEQVTRLIRWIATATWAALALQIFSLRNPLWQEGTAILATNLEWGALKMQLGAFLAFPITVWAAFALSRLIRFGLEEDVYPNLNLPRGIPYAISTMVHYAILVIGFFLALSAMGIDLSSYAVLAGAFGVGLGFGLQNIMNNFMSGLILLFERPIKVGDVVQIDANTIGTVERIGIRASIIQLNTGAELIMPNGNLISSPVTNWTLTNNERLVEIPVNVAPKTDIPRALNALIHSAKGHSDVLKNPPPQAVVVALAAASTSLKLRCWVDAEEDWMKLTSELSLAVQAALDKENIALA